MKTVLEIAIITLITIIAVVFIIRTVLVVAFYREQMHRHPETPRHRALLAAIERANP